MGRGADMSRPPTDDIPAVTPLWGRSDGPVPPADRGPPTWLAVSSVAIGTLILASWIFLAVAHADDRYRIDHVSGARIALARSAHEGVLYPELFDGEHYGGTRFMPLSFVVHGLVAGITDEYLLSGKLLSYAATLGLLATMVVALRRVRCPTPLQILLPALLLTTPTTLSASMNVRADVLPLVLQLLAVVLVSGSERTSVVIVAGVLAALALFTKTTALWAPLAIVVWLLFRGRGRLGWFIASYVGSSVALLLAFIVASDGRIVENVFGLAASGVDARSIVLAPYRLILLLVSDATPAWAILPLAGAVVWLASIERRASIYAVSLAFALLVLMVVLTDVGTGWNQLIDVVVLLAIVAGELAGRVDAPTRTEDGRHRLGAVIVGVALLWISTVGLVVTLVPDVRATIGGELDSRAIPLEGLADAHTAILSEDPYVPVSLGQAPVVLDPFMLLRLGRDRPEAVQELIGRIRSQEFELVVLVEPLEPLDRTWWNEEHFGSDVVDAIDRAYRFTGRVEGYYLYQPRVEALAP
jgi:hypothetical protein